MSGPVQSRKKSGGIPWVKLTISLVMAIFVVGTVNLIYHAKERIEKLIVREHGDEALRMGGYGYPAAVSKTEIPGMVYIPGGEFVMGSPLGNQEERPAHRVKVSAFYMDETLVSNKEYKKFIDATGHKAPPDWKGGIYFKGQDDLPVYYVSWYDADAYARWAEKRLPTEEEWEYAARGGHDYKWPWGDTWDENKANANYKFNGVTPVKKFKAGMNDFGLYDMAGNLFQWTSSPFKRYPGNKLEDWWYVKGLYVIRGGSWKSDIYSAKTIRRNSIPPDAISDFIGFRCARDAK